MSMCSSVSPVSSALPLAGDISRRRAWVALSVSLVGVLLSYGLFTNLDTLWGRILPLEGAAFMLLATLFGALLAVAPVAAGCGFLYAVWCGVESIYQPRRKVFVWGDRLIVLVGLLVWFGPSLLMLAAAIEALKEGRVHFSRPPRDYLMTTDPIAFWQGVGFWLIMSAILGFLAWRYWRNKLLKKC